MPNAHGAYREKIVMAEPMQLDEGAAGRLTLADRFNRIQGARERGTYGARKVVGKTLRLSNRPRQAKRFNK